MAQKHGSMSAERVRTLLERLGWSRARLSKHFGVRVETVNEWCDEGANALAAHGLRRLEAEHCVISGSLVRRIQREVRASAVSMARAFDVDVDTYQGWRKNGVRGHQAVSLLEMVREASALAPYPVIIASRGRAEVFAELYEDGSCSVDDGICVTLYRDLMEAQRIWTAWASIAPADAEELLPGEKDIVRKAKRVLHALRALEPDDIERRFLGAGYSEANLIPGVEDSSAGSIDSITRSNLEPRRVRKASPD
ncbi:MAG: hypothetical protein AAGI01_06715 [Myxococcota bacterium]